MFEAKRRLPLAVAGLILLTGNVAAGPQVELIGVGQLPGTATDDSGQSDRLENGVPHNRLGGFSALEFTGHGDRYVALPDRGPDDGATGYLCRFQLLDIHIDPGAEIPVQPVLIDSVLLKDRKNRHFTGAASAICASEAGAGRLDPEGFRFAASGDFFISDEYGPQLIEFASCGRELRRFALPDHLRVAHPADSKSEENRLNTTGRASNKGMEGLALSHDGRSLYGLMQHVLLQDGERLADGKPWGRHCRLVCVDIQSGAFSEFVYSLDSPENGVNEILAIDTDEFLVIERDSRVGAAARFKKIMKIRLAGATNIVDRQSLPADMLPKDIRPVHKEVFIDLLSPEFALPREQIPEKLEGLTAGRTLNDGRPTLLLSSDNDFEAAVPSLIYVFALPAENSLAETPVD